MKSQVTKWKKISMKEKKSNEGLKYRIHFIKTILNRAKEITSCVIKKTQKWKWALYHYSPGKANINHEEILSHIQWNSKNWKDWQYQGLTRMWSNWIANRTVNWYNLLELCLALSLKAKYLLILLPSIYSSKYIPQIKNSYDQLKALAIQFP